MRPLAASWCAVLVIGGASAGAMSAGAAAAAPGDDPILEALKKEVSRAQDQLQLGQLEKPYFVECAVSDEETLQVAASFGAVTQAERSRARPLRAAVRVGGYNLDNSGFFSRSSLFGERDDEMSLVLDDAVPALRHDIWLALDAAYKRALEQLAQKRAVLQNKVQAEQTPDFAKAEPVVSIEPRQPPAPDEAPWKAKVARLSAIFREFPAIQKSDVRLWVYAGTRYLVNSEGSAVRQPASLVALVARAETQAADGAPLKHFAPFYATSLETLPAEEALAAGIRRMGGELNALAAAPTLDKYIGPVLFTEQASAEVFAQLLAPQLCGRRPPLSDDERLAAELQTPNLAERIGRRVLPPFLSVVDDPTQTSFEGQALLGSYRFDDEGVPARRVALIDRGVLKSLVMSRRPRKDITQSNGHARAVRSEAPVAQIGNLFVSVPAGGKTRSELKQALIEACKAQDLPFGLMITRLDNPRISGAQEDSMAFFGFGRPSQSAEMTAPTLVYKVSVQDGKEELVRGLAIDGMVVRTLKEITAAGSESFVENLPLPGPLAGFDDNPIADLGADAAPGSVVAPGVLFDEVELNRSRGPQERPAILERPPFK